MIVHLQKSNFCSFERYATSLVGSLINSLKFNINRYQNRVRLFEISHIQFKQNKNMTTLLRQVLHTGVL